MGAVSRRARSEADQFYYDLVYGPRRRPRQWAEAEPTLYTTGAVAARPGWTFVAYLGPRVARLAFNVLRPTPAGRIGNVGWVTNNPGSIDLSPPFKIVNGARVKSGVGERAAVDHGAFEKNLTDIKDYRRFAVFPTLELGERAVLPVLFVFARANNNPRVGEVLRIYYGIQDPAARVRYENEIRARLARSYASRLALTDPGLSDTERNARATELANGLLNRKTLELERFVTDDSQFLERAVLDVESARDMARVGLRYTCAGFANLDEVRSIYAREADKLREIEAVVGSAAAKAQLDAALGCSVGVRA